MLKLGQYLFCGFCDQKVHLGVSCAIIKIDDLILSTSDTVLHQCTEIRIHELKWRRYLGGLCTYDMLLFCMNTGWTQSWCFSARLLRLIHRLNRRDWWLVVHRIHNQLDVQVNDRLDVHMIHDQLDVQICNLFS